MRTVYRNHQSGFTIVELLIATAVFAVLLVIITTGALQFTRQYYKGVISSNTQSATRAIMDDVVRALQFNKGGIVPLTRVTAAGPTGEYGFCIGDNKRYSMKLNAQVIGSGANPSLHQSRHGLVSESFTGCSSSTLAYDVTSATLPPNGRELLGDNMRLVNLAVNTVPGSTDTFIVTVRVLYGDDDLVCSPDVTPATNAGGCRSGGFPGTAIDGKKNLQCKVTTGSQFCAMSELSTVVQKRMR